jgi:hypothetical protein
LDFNYFGINPEGDYGFVHGKGDDGGDVVVRSITGSEFDMVSSWFEDRQKGKRNPFTRLNF